MGSKNLSTVFSVQLCVCIVFFLSIAGCNREQEKPKAAPPSVVNKEDHKTVSNEVVATITVLATIAGHEKATSVDPFSGNKPVFQVVFNDAGRGVAYLAQKDDKTCVVHNGKTGRLYKQIVGMALSPDGQSIAYAALVDNKWRMVLNGSEGTMFDEVGEPVFSADSRHIAYQARSGDKRHIVVDKNMSSGDASYSDKPVFSGDSTKIAYVENTNTDNKKRLVVSDLEFKKQSVRESPVSSIITNRDSTRIAAVSENNNKQRVIEFSFDQPDRAKEGPLYDGISNLVFGADGVSVAYSAVKDGASLIILNNREERLPDGSIVEMPVIRPDRKGVGLIIVGGDTVSLHQAFYNDGAESKKYQGIYDLVYSGDAGKHAYAAENEKSFCVVVNGKKGPAFDKVIRPAFSPDGRFIVYRARKDGKRFVVVSDTNGKVLRQHPAYEQVFQPVFTADGQSIAYGVKDGNKLIWKVEKL